jgi:hypothetical protein
MKPLLIKCGRIHSDRSALVEAIHFIAGRVEGLSHCRINSPTARLVRCETSDLFTAMGVFNRCITADTAR